MNKKIIFIFVLILFISFRSHSENTIVQTYDFFSEVRKSFNATFGADTQGLTEDGFTCRVLFEDSNFGMGPLIRIQVIRRGYITEGVNYRFEIPTQNMTTHQGPDGYAYVFVNSMNSGISIYFGSTFYSIEINQSEHQNLSCKFDL